jgi:hypothetical protein
MYHVQSTQTNSVIQHSMSMLFILQGCICSLKVVNNKEAFPTRYDCLFFFQKKMFYVYPLVFFFSVCRTPEAIYWTHHRNETAVSHFNTFSCVANYFVVGQWINCDTAINIVGEGWYVNCLFLCWLVFPFAQPYLVDFWQTNVHLKLIALYFLVNVLSLIQLAVPVHKFAWFRLIEFLMGTAIPYVMHQTISRPLVVGSSCGILCTFCIGFYVDNYVITSLWSGLSLQYVIFIISVIQAECRNCVILDIIKPFSIIAFLGHGLYANSLRALSALLQLPFIQNDIFIYFFCFGISSQIFFIYNWCILKFIQSWTPTTQTPQDPLKETYPPLSDTI